MNKTLTRLVFSLWIVGAPLSMVGCSEGEKPATTTAPTASTETGPSTVPVEGAPATTTPAEAPK